MKKSHLVWAIVFLIAVYLIITGTATEAEAASNKRNIPLYEKPEDCTRWYRGFCADKPVRARRTRDNNYIPRTVRKPAERVYVPKRVAPKRVRPVGLYKNVDYKSSRTRRREARINYNKTDEDVELYKVKLKEIQKRYSERRTARLRKR